jgi:hypothetical protein
VVEGVTGIPGSLCCCGKRQGFVSLETVVFPKSVAVIQKWSFGYCINLKSVVFPNDSQLREIGSNAFEGCNSLLSIAIPDGVTTIGEEAFSYCHKLESVLFTGKSCLQKIGDFAFFHCTSLQSIIIPKSVVESGQGAFQSCSKLQTVIFAEHSSIQTIKTYTFYQCTSLQFISIPTTVTSIDEYAFERCLVLQVIDIPHQAKVGRFAFHSCPLLEEALELLKAMWEEHGTDGTTGCFDALPIHQTCYKLNVTSHANDSIINYIHSLQDNDPDLLQVDIMGMTPLHILSANPAVKKDMIKQMYIKNTAAAAVRNVNDMLPWHMYAVNKDKHFCMFNEHKDEYGRIMISTTKTDTARMILSNEFDVDKLVDANLDIDVIEMYLILTGSSLFEWAETANAVSGMYPFLSMAKSNCNNLETVYDVAMMNMNIFQRDYVLQEIKKNKATDERTRDAKRVKLA